MLKVTPTALPEVLILEPRVLGDTRGFFLESWNRRTFADATGLDPEFVQDCHSRSGQNVLRGLHYQLTKPQGKLVRVTAGRVFDVTVDLRRSSPRLAQWAGVELSADNHRQLWIPPGFAHGFVVLSEYADFLYKATDYYAPEDEHTLAWDDSLVGVQWPLADMSSSALLSVKDQKGNAWNDCVIYD